MLRSATSTALDISSTCGRRVFDHLTNSVDVRTCHWMLLHSSSMSCIKLAACAVVLLMPCHVAKMDCTLSNYLEEGVRACHGVKHMTHRCLYVITNKVIWVFGSHYE